MKKAISVLLAASMVFGLAACGQQKSSETKAAGESKADGQSEAGKDGAVWKIGGIGPVTGGAAVYGLACKNAQQIAVDEINAAGGINGYKVEIEGLGYADAARHGDERTLYSGFERVREGQHVPADPVGFRTGLHCKLQHLCGLLLGSAAG